MEKTFLIGGMSCASCSSYIMRSVSALEGVKLCEVNLLAKKMIVDYDETIISSEKIVGEVVECGYTAGPYISPEESVKKEICELKSRLIKSIVFLVPLMYISMGEMLGFPLPYFLSGHENALYYAALQLILLLPILIVNYKIITRGFKNLFRLAPNMDSLIAVGSSAATAYGIFALIMIAVAIKSSDMMTVAHYHMQLYFESAGTILTLVTLGKLFEALSKHRTGDAVRKLMSLAPKMSTVIENGEETQVLTSQIRKKQIVAVKPGETVPLDGIVESGYSSVDDSALTGESLPVEINKGDIVSAAAKNLNGYFTFKVTNPYGTTTLDKMIDLVEKASSGKTGSARLADKISGVFTPVVMLIAVLCFAIWLIIGGGFSKAFQMSISVLVISCPCALGLATPVAIMVGVGRGAQKGVLFKNASSVEMLCRVKNIVFDKTGTLTKGKPIVTDVIYTEGADKPNVLSAVYAIEKMSEHPLAVAVTEYAKEQNASEKNAENFMSLAGMGTKAFVDGIQYYIGNEKLMTENGADVSEVFESVNKMMESGSGVIYVASDGVLCAVIFVQDEIRQDSRQTIEKLTADCINTVMLTGDNSRTANAVGKALSIEKVISEVMPQQKESHVSDIKKSGITAMVGDGINDAPSLSTADIGIAVGNGTDIAIDAADIVLMNSKTDTIIKAINLSKKISKNIKMNLFWAFFYNAVGIPVAAGAFSVFGIVLNPMIAAAAMSLSSLFVVLNALRLNNA